MTNRFRRFKVGCGSQDFGSLRYVPAFEPTLLNDPTSSDEFLMKAMAVTGNDSQARMCENRWRAESGAGNNACGDTIDLLAVGWSPNLSTEKTEATLHQTVIQVCQHNVIST